MGVHTFRATDPTSLQERRIDALCTRSSFTLSFLHPVSEALFQPVYAL